MPTTISTPFCERVDLRLVRHAAVERAATRTPRRAPAAARSSRDLQAQLAGRDDDERLRRPLRPRRGVARSSSGMPKPRVLPVPVRAWPMRSAPRSAIGSAYSWMAKGVVMPTSASAAQMRLIDAEVGEGFE